MQKDGIRHRRMPSFYISSSFCLFHSLHQEGGSERNHKGADDVFCEGGIIAVGIEGIGGARPEILEEKKQKKDRYDAELKKEHPSCKADFMFFL